jgi:hypothetical protein
VARHNAARIARKPQHSRLGREVTQRIEGLRNRPLPFEILVQVGVIGCKDHGARGSRDTGVLGSKGVLAAGEHANAGQHFRRIPVEELNSAGLPQIGKHTGVD